MSAGDERHTVSLQKVCRPNRRRVLDTRDRHAASCRPAVAPLPLTLVSMEEEISLLEDLFESSEGKER